MARALAAARATKRRAEARWARDAERLRAFACAGELLDRT